MLQIIRSIIGYFNLDPNRVLDVILDSFEMHLDSHEFFVELVPVSQTSVLSQFFFKS
jgi:THO complex subunit 2